MFRILDAFILKVEPIEFSDSMGVGWRERINDDYGFWTDELKKKVLL